MRILQIGPVPPEAGGRTQGGVASHLWALSSYLSQKGHTIGVLGDNLLAEDASPLEVDGIQLFGMTNIATSMAEEFLLRPASWMKIFRTRRHFGPLRGWKGVISGLVNYQRVIELFQPDLIHIHHLEYRFPLTYYLVEDRIPILTTVHSTSLIEFSSVQLAEERIEFIQRNLAKAQNLVFVSEFLKNRYTALFPGSLETKQTKIIHNLVDKSAYFPIPRESARDQLGLPLEGSLILFVGKLIQAKGLEILIQAGKLLRDRGMNFQVIVVGSGPQEAELRKLVQELGLVEQVRFEGPKSQAELFLYYNAADVFALPSVMESFGLVFIEAMLCGCPVIGRPEVLREILPSQRCGLQLGSSRPEDWAEEISKALNRSWSKEEIQGSAAHFTWEVSGERFEALYQALVA